MFFLSRGIRSAGSSSATSSTTRPGACPTVLPSMAGVLPGGWTFGYPVLLALALFAQLAASQLPAAAQAGASVRELQLNSSSRGAGDSDGDILAPAFSPDGKLVFFGRRVGEGMSIFVSDRKNGAWTEPRVASFSGEYTDLEPAFAPSGEYIIFASNRPLTPGGPLAEGNYDAKVRPGHGGRLWRVDRTANGWSEAHALPAGVNASDSTFSPAITGDGSLYFMRPVNPGERFHLYRAQMAKGVFAQPERVSFSNLDAFGDFDPVVAKDESFLIFSSPRPPALEHRSDIFIVFRSRSGWSAPVDLRGMTSEDVFGVEARLSPDEKTLYFSNRRKLTSDPADKDGSSPIQHTWQVDLTAVRRLSEH